MLYYTTEKARSVVIIWFTMLWLVISIDREICEVKEKWQTLNMILYKKSEFFLRMLKGGEKKLIGFPGMEQLQNTISGIGLRNMKR